MEDGRGGVQWQRRIEEGASRAAEESGAGVQGQQRKVGQGSRGSRRKWGRGPGAAEERKGEGETEGDSVLKDRGVQEQRRILGGSEVE